jgi:hypothetical protein
MSSHFFHLFLRIVHGMPGLVSSNWAAWLLGVVVFVLYHLLVLCFRGWREMGKRWLQNLGFATLAAALGYIALFSWSAIQTTYDDHHDSTGRWQAVVNEKNILKVGLATRDDYIHTLESRTCPACSGAGTRTVVKEEPRQCWVAEIVGGPVTKDSLSSDVAAIYCNYRIDAPWCAGATFNKDTFNNGNSFLASGFVMGGARPGKQGNTFTECHSGPPIPPHQLITVTVYGTEPNPPRLVSARVKSQ